MTSSPPGITSHTTARIAVAGAFALILAGGLVTSRDAGLAVPDWPLAYGQLNPPSWWRIENVRTEHGHRILAFLVASWTAFLLWRVLRFETAVVVRRLAMAAAGLVLLQALLGGLRVLHLSVDLAMVHGVTGQIFFATLVALATVTAPGWQQPRAAADRSDRTLGSALLGCVIAQLVLGIFIRHLGGEVRPLASSLLYYAHVSVAGLVLCLALELRRRALANDGNALPGTRGLLVLVAFQIVLGIGSFIVTDAMVYDRQATMLESWLPTFHVACGAAILGASVVLNMIAWRGRALRVEQIATASERELAA